MIAHDQHSSFIKTPQQLIVVILLAFIVPINVIMMLVQLATSVPSADPEALDAQKVAERIQPVGRLEVGAPQAPAPAAQAKAPASVLKGKGAMPPKGGNASLSEAQVRAAVEFMISQSK